MKKLIGFSLAILTIACNGIIGNGYTINGEVKGVKDGTKVFLEKQDEQTGINVAVDTVEVKNEKFTFEGKAEEPEIKGIRIENIQGAFAVITEKGSISAIVNKDSIGKTKVSGTYNNDEMSSYMKKMETIQKKMMAFQQKNIATMQAAQEKNDTVTMNRLQKEFMGFQKELTTFNENYVSNSPKSFISVLLIQSLFNQEKPELEKIKKYYDALDSDLKESKPGKNVKKKIEDWSKYLESQKKTSVGEIAPDFSAKTPEGKTISLKESLGKVTIIDFWASWCAPCRQSNPEMVKLYNELHPKGLNIIGVSLDRENGEKDWKDAIAKDKLTWTQVSNLKHWDEPIAKQYGIQSIPSLVIIDASGKIVAKDLHGDALKQKVTELLAK